MNRSRYARRLAGILVLILGLGSPALQADSSGDRINPLEDGRLTREELDIIKKSVAGDLTRLQETLLAAMVKDLEDDGLAAPAAVMMMNDKDIKNVTIPEAEKIGSARVAIEAYRAGLRSVARHGQIMGAVIGYTVEVNGDRDEFAILTEYEHRLGVSGKRLIPYRVREGQLELGKGQDTGKSFYIFHDEKQQVSE